MDERERTIRKAARRRSSLLQGAGFALLGHPLPARLGLAWTAVSLAAVVLVSFVEVSPVGRYQVVVHVPEAPARIIVPPDCFFVVQEQPSKALDRRTISWMRREDVLGTKLWLVSLRGPGKEL